MGQLLGTGHRPPPHPASLGVGLTAGDRVWGAWRVWGWGASWNEEAAGATQGLPQVSAGLWVGAKALLRLGCASGGSWLYL